MREVAGREIVVNLVDRGLTDLVAARPLLESVVAVALTTDPFERVYRLAVREIGRALFVRGNDEVTLGLADPGQTVALGTRAVSPKLARAARCARERRQPVNLIAVDHYDQGELIPAVAELNARRVRAHRAGVQPDR